MKSFGSAIFTAILIGGIGMYKSAYEPGPNLPDNAPAGAVDYFESRDQSDFVALYQDRLQYKFSGFLGGAGTVPVSQIQSLRKWGDKVVINTTKGQLEFQIEGLFGRQAARRFVDDLKELISDNRP